MNPFIEHHKTPGQYIEALLNQRRWTKRTLSLVMEIDEPTINKIISGKRTVDATMAIALSEVFSGAEAADFLELQKRYDLAQARYLSQPNPERAVRAQLFGDFPITDMVKRGWLQDVDSVRDVAKVQAAAQKFFGVDSLEKIKATIPHAAKKSNADDELTLAQFSWFQRVKEIASEMVVPKYSASALRSAVVKLGTLLFSAEEIRKVPRILAESGVRFVIVESLPGAKIDGVCFWLNAASPVIGMSLRFDRIDNFWFVLRHECEHVLRQHGMIAPMLDTDLDGEKTSTESSVPEEERQANEAAAEFCVPKKDLDQFFARKFPVFADHDIVGFSRTLKIHPGIVAGQIRNRTKRWNRFHNHLVKIRTIIAPSAVIDGWGTVASVGEEN